MSKFVFEPHNLHGETVDGEAMPFGYITQIQESGHRLPVFELNTVFGEMPGIDLAGLARIMAAAPAMAALLRGIDRDEDGDAMLDASGMDEIAAILSRIDGAGDTLPDAPAPAPTTDLQSAARALLDAFGGNVPDWLTGEAQALESALNGGPAPTGELVTVRADHLAALVGAAGKYADDLETGLEDGTYDDRADLDAVRAALAVVQGEN